jgi:hypothetical protein
MQGSDVQQLFSTTSQFSSIHFTTLSGTSEKRITAALSKITLNNFNKLTESQKLQSKLSLNNFQK